MSCERFTVLVGVDEQEIIREAPPIVRRFVGQRLVNLASWMRKLGGYRACYFGEMDSLAEAREAASRCQ